MDSGRERVLAYIRTNGRTRPVNLARHLNLSRMAVHKILKKLTEKEELVKFGTAPRVYYSLPHSTGSEPKMGVGERERSIIEENYLYVTATGEMLEGWAGFERWVREIGQSQKLESLAKEYVDQRREANKMASREGWIEATGKFRTTFAGNWLDSVYYKDFYSLPNFGKTRLGQLVLYAKQSQNRSLMKQVAQICKPVIGAIVEKHKISAVGYIPPTIPRQIQFQTELDEYLALPIPKIKFRKVYSGRILVAQKTLSRFAERVANAKETIVIEDDRVKFDCVLLIDDAVGSGATLNETAKKLKEAGMAKTVIGFAVVGSMKGFEVIQEV